MYVSVMRTCVCLSVWLTAGDIAFRFIDFLKNMKHSSDSPVTDSDSHVTVCDINQAMLDVGKSKATSRGCGQSRFIIIIRFVLQHCSSSSANVIHRRFCSSKLPVYRNSLKYNLYLLMFRQLLLLSLEWRCWLFEHLPVDIAAANSLW